MYNETMRHLDSAFVFSNVYAFENTPIAAKHFVGSSSMQEYTKTYYMVGLKASIRPEVLSEFVVELDDSERQLGQAKRVCAEYWEQEKQSKSCFTGIGLIENGVALGQLCGMLRDELVYLCGNI